jgi:hypothetical protein
MKPREIVERVLRDSVRAPSRTPREHKTRVLERDSNLHGDHGSSRTSTLTRTLTQPTYVP